MDEKLEVSTFEVEPTSLSKMLRTGKHGRDVYEKNPKIPVEPEPLATSHFWFPRMNRFVLGAALIASISSGLLGYDVGVTSGALLFIEDDFHLTDFQQEVFVSCLSLISLVGALISGKMADVFGRRKAIIAASVIFFVGSLTMALAPNYSILMTGRLVTGVGVGFGFTAAPLYTAELASPDCRGMLVSLSEVFINFGILVGYIASFLMKNLPDGVNWRCMLGFGGFPAILLGLGVLFVPESPRWLVMVGRTEEAKCVLMKTSKDKNEASFRLNEIIEANSEPMAEEESIESKPDSGAGLSQSEAGRGTEKIDESDRKLLLEDSVKLKKRSVWYQLLNPSSTVKKMLIVCIGTNFFQQATGIDALVYYSPVIFREGGIHDRSELLGAAVVMGIVKTAFILIAMALLDRFGRRPLLLISSAGMTASLLLESFGFLLLRQQAKQGILSSSFDGSAGSALVVVASYSFVAFFSVGLGPVNWVLTSEIFPLKLRAQAFALGTAVNRIASGAVALTFLSLGDVLSPAGSFFAFACVGCLSVLFFYLFAPETKGKSLEEIEKMFENSRSGLFGTKYDVVAQDNDVL